VAWKEEKEAAAAVVAERAMGVTEGAGAVALAEGQEVEARVKVKAVAAGVEAMKVEVDTMEAPTQVEKVAGEKQSP
jgi:hypothetical protein